jgi:2-dehydro-3-deoxyphosphogluconate aldolase/(4S)-4-hydroxy-2-oxoglutarate aldolase
LRRVGRGITSERSGRERPWRRRRQAPYGAVAQRSLEIRDRVDDLVEGTALAARIGKPLTREEPPRLVLMKPARRPALEQAVVDGAAHAPCIGTLLRLVESAAAERGLICRVEDEREAAIVARLRACRVVPVATIEDAALAPTVGEALLAGGVGCIEITFRHPAAAEAIRRAREVEGLLVGAGTVLSAEQARAAAAAGALFAVAPGTNEEVVRACDELGLPFFPGIATASEIEYARHLGRHVVKVFPAAQVGGPAFLRAVSATYPDVGFIPTGGIDATGVDDYLAVPSVIACGGSWLVRHELVRERRFDEIERLAREAVESGP